MRGDSIHDRGGATKKCPCATGCSRGDLRRISRRRDLSRRNVHCNRERSRRTGNARRQGIGGAKGHPSEAHRQCRNSRTDCRCGNASRRFDTGRDRTRPAVTRILAGWPASNGLDSRVGAGVLKLYHALTKRYPRRVSPSRRRDPTRENLGVELGEPGIEELLLIVCNVQKKDAHSHSFLHVNDLPGGHEGALIA